MFSFAALALLLGAGLVQAHGNVQSIEINGESITAYQPFQDPYVQPTPPARSTRNYPSNGPVEDITTSDVQCNVGAQPAKLVNTIAAGDEIKFSWTEWPDSHKGPVLTYMARAPEGTNVTAWDASDAEWFKIDEAGWTAANGWAATDVLTGKQNSIWTSTIPADLKAGQYLIRHEIIALHSAGSYPGAQLYMACVQLDVTGSGSALPTSGLVKFPGAYGTAAAPGDGIVYNLYGSDDHSDYKTPGPAVWDGKSSAIGGGSAPASSSAAAPAPTSTAAPEPSVPAEPSVTDTAVPTVTDTAAPSVTDTAAPSDTDTAAPSVTDTAAPTVTDTAAPSATDAPSVPATTDAPPATSAAPTDAPAPTTSAAAPAPTGAKNANDCWREYNACLDKSQPTPDFATCTAARETCTSGATYQRLARSGTLGRRLAGLAL